MTNSYFSPQAQPRDTYVTPSTTAPFAKPQRKDPPPKPSQTNEWTGLVNALAIVNPAINRYLDYRIEMDFQKQEANDTLEAIQEELGIGNISKFSNKLRKNNGDNAARETLGGSITTSITKQKVKTKLKALKLENLFQTKYNSAQINNQPLYKYAPDSEEIKNWKESIINSAIEDLGDIDPVIFNKHFIPTLLKESHSITSYHTKEYKTHQFNELQADIPEAITRVSQLIVAGENDKAKTVINEFTEDLYAAGVTGEDATNTYKNLITNTFAKARILAVDLDNPITMKIAEELPEKLLKMIPWGSDDLTKHPDYLIEAAEFHEQYSQNVLNKLRNGPKIEQELNKQLIENKWKELNSIKITNDMNPEQKQKAIEAKRETFAALINDPQYSSKELQNYVQSLGKSDNYDLKVNVIPEIKKKILSGIYDGYSKELEQEIAIAENNHITMDNEAIEEFTKLKTFARTAAKDLAPKIDRSINKVMKQVDNQLGTGGLLLRGKKTDFKKSTAIRYRVQKQLTKYYQDFIENNERFPSSLEIQQIETQYTWQVLGAEKIFDQKEVEARYPSSEFDNPFYEPPTTQGGEEGEEKDSEEKNKFLAPGMNFEQSSNQPQDQAESEDLIAQLTNLIGQFAPGGGSPVAAGELEGKPLPDYGGLAELVRGGESAGSGLYNAYNGGTTGSAASMDITSKTIAEMEQMQKENKVFAVGAYQFTPGVLAEAREYAGIEADAIMTPAVQDRLFWGMILSGRKRPALTDYLLGNSDDIKAAQEDLAYEFAAIQGPDGVGMYDNDAAGNYATIKSDLVKQALVNARKAISNK